LLLGFLPGAAALFPGEEPLVIDGTLLLRARAEAGIPFELLGHVEGGDTLRFEWSIEGGAGPAVRFELRGGAQAIWASHSIYETVASSDRGEIWLPGSPPYYAGWFNFNDVSVSLTFAMTVLPGLISPDALLMLLVFGIVCATAFVLWRVTGGFWKRQRKIQDYLDSLRKT
jgi:hypothetical protein